MEYTVVEIDNNVAKIQFSDGSYTFVELKADMTESELDELVYLVAPAKLKGGEGTPSFLTAGAKRTASVSS